MREELRQGEVIIDPTWMAKTGGFARDMTLHDYYAGLAMQGFVAYSWTKGKYMPLDNEIANEAHRLADAMLKARETK